MINYLCIIQARIGSTRFPNKVMQTVGGVPMVKRVWLAAKEANVADKVIVAWPERYPDLDEGNVLERFRRIVKEYMPRNIIRLTSDCPLIEAMDIRKTVYGYEDSGNEYYSNHMDGRDVQICRLDYLFYGSTNREHVFNDPSYDMGLSVNIKEDLEKVRKLCAR